MIPREPDQNNLSVIKIKIWEQCSTKEEKTKKVTKEHLTADLNEK